jgi:hypothetical protein
MYSTYSLLCALRISARHSRRIGMVVSCGIEPAYSSFSADVDAGLGREGKKKEDIQFAPAAHFERRPDHSGR